MAGRNRSRFLQLTLQLKAGAGKEYQMKTRQFIQFVLVMACLCSLAQAQSSVLTYLQRVADQYQETVDVYLRADDAGNHFPARGRFNSANGESFVPAMDEISSSAPCIRTTCITARFLARGTNWGGWYFLNGVLGPKDTQPALNWGDQPNAGYELSGATKLQFFARGAAGGEKVEFFAFGVGNTLLPFMPYPDSALKQSTGELVLSTA